MEGDAPTAVGTSPTAIKMAQEEIGRLDVLVCGQCHSVFHFVEEFQEHREKEGACSRTSQFRENTKNEQKAQVWAFLLWKDSQIQQDGSERDAANSWKLYQKWCKMDSYIRDSWIAAGKTIQTFTKISNAKMQDMPRLPHQASANIDGSKSIVVRKVIRNGQPEEASEQNKESKPSDIKTTRNVESTNVNPEIKDKPKMKPSIKPKVKPTNIIGSEATESSDEEYVIEKILAKRFNPKKRCSEFLLKWEGYPHDRNTWEPAESVSVFKDLLEEFERNLAKQKELKAGQQTTIKVIGRSPMTPQKTVMKSETKPGPSTPPQAGRPMRSSKSKALDQVKQWCGSMKDEENELLGKRRMDYSDSESDDGCSNAAKRAKGDTGSDEDWTAESEEERLASRSDVIQRAFHRADVQSNDSNRTTISGTEIPANLNLQSPEMQKSCQTPVLVANAKGVVKVDPKQMPNLTSGVYVMSRKDGIIKLDSSPSGKIAVKGSPTQGILMVQNRDSNNVVRKQVLSGSQVNSIAPVKVVSKPDGNQMVTQMKVITKPLLMKSPGATPIKNEPIKIQPKPDPTQLQQIHVVTAVSNPVALRPRMTPGVRSSPGSIQRNPDGRPLLPRPALRATTPIGLHEVCSPNRTPVRASMPKQVQCQSPRQVLQKRLAVTAVQCATSSPNVVPTQVRSKFTVLNSTAKQSQKTVPSLVQSKQLPKVPLGKAQSLLSPQQKLLMAKRKAQEAVGLIKAGNRGLLAGARGAPGRSKSKFAEAVNAAAGASPAPGSAAANKPKESKLVEGDGLHMEFHVGTEESSSEGESADLLPQDAEAVQPIEPESPPRPFTLCPLTGRIMGPDGEPMEQTAEQETPAQDALAAPLEPSVPLAAVAVDNPEATAASNAAELVLPSLESLTETGSIMRVEMSPGGTTGTIVQTSEPAQMSLPAVGSSTAGLPCLDDTPAAVTSTSTPALTEAVAPAAEAAPSVDGALAAAAAAQPDTPELPKTEEKTPEDKKPAEDASSLVTITGEDGIVYQVAGQAEDGQTLLVTRGADGEQQCVYVTTEQQGDEGSVLTLDHAVAEAVAQLIPDQVNLTSQFYVKEGEAEPAENQMVMSIMDNAGNAATATQEDSDGQAQVVAQVVQADDPTPGGTRRVVLLLPDGNLMMTEVDEEQYAALELDK
ncbi:uncharacterized protein LOC105696852 [Orussus abietinus]|uniref:uncharacterized protein LOC105696852 n=1 Tax=Orussus abietinus TaxID=222816 RepID=UPI000626ADA6|nr:uncharacterized protein LOC105696852 [Orussus abietinus]XP_012275058.1 uncharacterized protein LOC105696852 [Orussus abietinus]XP_012275059.1 uncharacterized protein LOC105696852 [Orussus abietinus]